MSSAIPWAAAVLILGIIAIIRFGPHLGRLIDRAHSIGGRFGVQASPPEQIQAGSEATLPARTALEPDSGRPALPAAGEPPLETDDLIRGMDTPAVLTRDRYIRTQLDRMRNRDDRERVVIRTLAAQYVLGDFNRIYSVIFGSQILVLATLNSAGDTGLSLDALRPFYDNAAQRYPEAYKNDTLERWLDFLKSSELIRDSQNGVAITQWGTEFLDHLVRLRRPAFKDF